MSSRCQAGMFKRDEAWQSHAHRAVFLFCAVCLSLYFSYILFLAHSPVFLGLWETIYCLAWFLAYGALLFAGFCAGCKRLLRTEPRRRSAAQKPAWSWRFFVTSAGVSGLLLGISWLAAYPGAVTYDIYNQWMQTQTGQYNSWHPVFHTLLLWLGGQLTGSYPGVVAVQLVSFSLALAYLMATLRAWNVLRGGPLLVLQGLIVLSPLVNGVLMGAGKDAAMTLGAVVLCAQGVGLYLSHGEWAKKPQNAVTFGVALAYTTLTRHNAFFFTVPLLLCAFFTCVPQRGRVLLSAGVMAVCVALVSGPLYSALDLVRPKNTFAESVGIPMTVLCDMRAEYPELLEGETRDFLETLLPDEDFADKYVLHHYNSVKFEWPMEYIANEPPARLLGMVLRAAESRPQSAFQTFNAVTDLVWGVAGNNEAYDSAKNSGDLAAYRYQNTRMNQMGKSIKGLLTVPLGLPGVSWLFQNIGVQMALLLLCALWALYRSGPRALVLCVPVLFYNLGTMLLLCGNDARFFQFSMVICLPAALALGRRPHPGPAEEAAEQEPSL